MGFWRSVGKVLKPAAPFIGGALGSIIPGVGTALGAGLGGAIGGMSGGGDLKHRIRNAAIGGGTGYFGAKVLGSVPGLSKLGGLGGGAGGAASGGLAAAEGLGGSALAEGAGAGGAGFLGSLGSWAAKNPMVLGAGLNAGANLLQGGQQTDLQRRALDQNDARTAEDTRRYNAENAYRTSPQYRSFLQQLAQRFGMTGGMGSG